MHLLHEIQINYKIYYSNKVALNNLFIDAEHARIILKNTICHGYYKKEIKYIR